jgi:hypothetical protein
MIQPPGANVFRRLHRAAVVTAQRDDNILVSAREV